MDVCSLQTDDIHTCMFVPTRSNTTNQCRLWKLRYYMDTHVLRLCILPKHQSVLIMQIMMVYILVVRCQSADSVDADPHQRHCRMQMTKYTYNRAPVQGDLRTLWNQLPIGRRR